MGTRLAVLRQVARQHLAALALGQRASGAAAKMVPLRTLAAVGILLLHLAGLGAFWRYYHQPVWLALPTLAILLAFPLIVSRRGPAIETLAPLFFLYAILIARVIAVRVLLANEPYQDEASFADPRFIFFQVEATTAAVIGYTALVQVSWLTGGERRDRGLAILALLLGTSAFAWFAAETLVHRTRGVTATDPYAYVQMAVDLVSHGTPLHAFPLFPNVVNLNVSWYPVEHIGYQLFGNLSGSVPTVWPIGGSVLLAGMYRLIGEEGLYLSTPLAALAALVAFAFFLGEYFRDRPLPERAAITAIGVLLLATSWEQVDRSIVPLVDAQAQLFSVLAILFAFQAARTGANRAGSLAYGVAVLSGVCLGAAYFIRHTQLLLVVPMVMALWSVPWRARLRLLVLAGCAALIVALPDLWYHHEYFGGWFTPESRELALFSASNAADSAVSLSQRFLAGNEFGYLIAFLAYGIYRTARDSGSKFAVLATWIVLLSGFHLLYAAVKIRDLLPEYPAVILLTAYGMVALVRDLRGWAGSATWKRSVLALAIFLVLLFPAMRDRLTILRPFQPVKVTFGYVTDAQRAAFARIAALTPPDAVIGSTMNDGAIDLYAHRATFRPGAWSADEALRFVESLRMDNRPVYLLDDGAETSAARRDLSEHFTLRRIAALDVPLFGEVDDTPGALWEIGSTNQTAK